MKTNVCNLTKALDFQSLTKQVLAALQSIVSPKTLQKASPFGHRSQHLTTVHRASAPYKASPVLPPYKLHIDDLTKIWVFKTLQSPHFQHLTKRLLCCYLTNCILMTLQRFELSKPYKATFFSTPQVMNCKVTLKQHKKSPPQGCKVLKTHFDCKVTKLHFVRLHEITIVCKVVPKGLWAIKRRRLGDFVWP